MRLPIAVRDLDDRLGPGAVGLTWSEEPAEGRSQAECGEIVAGHEQPIRPLGASSLADVEGDHPKCEKLAKRSEALGQVPVLEPGRTWKRASLCARLDELVCTRIGHARQGLEDHRLQPRKDHHVHANANGERQNHHG